MASSCGTLQLPAPLHQDAEEIAPKQPPVAPLSNPEGDSTNKRAVKGILDHFSSSSNMRAPQVCPAILSCCCMALSKANTLAIEHFKAKVLTLATKFD
jgi:hypothetical protein